MGTRMLAMFSSSCVPSSWTFDQTSGSETSPNEPKSMPGMKSPPAPVKITIVLSRSRPTS